jgi:hypothetical protein
MKLPVLVQTEYKKIIFIFLEFNYRILLQTIEIMCGKSF